MCFSYWKSICGFYCSDVCLNKVLFRFFKNLDSQSFLRQRFQFFSLPELRVTSKIANLSVRMSKDHVPVNFHVFGFSIPVRFQKTTRIFFLRKLHTEKFLKNYFFSRTFDRNNRKINKKFARKLSEKKFFGGENLVCMKTVITSKAVPQNLF